MPHTNVRILTRHTALRRSIPALLLLAALAAGCSSSGQDSPQDPAQGGNQLNVQPRAAYDLAATGEAERFITGVVTSGNRSLVGGTVDMDFAFLGAESADGTPQPGPTAQGSFLAVPQKAPERTYQQPTAVAPAEAVGVYQTQVAFDEPGYWQVTVTADMASGDTVSGTGAFYVLEEHLVPQVGDDAPKATNLTMDDVGDVPKAAIDSRAGTGEATIPDPILHRTTVNQALAQQRPFVIVFSTPVWCQSQFCGPITESVQQLASEYGDRAAFIHVEVWRDFEAKELNDAYDAWVNQGGEGREPWLFTVGTDGVIDQRWDNVPDMDAVESWLQNLPSSGS